MGLPTGWWHETGKTTRLYADIEAADTATPQIEQQYINQYRSTNEDMAYIQLNSYMATTRIAQAMMWQTIQLNL